MHSCFVVSTSLKIKMPLVCYTVTYYTPVKMSLPLTVVCYLHG